LKHVYNLHKELKNFNQEEKVEFEAFFSKDEKLGNMTYLADMFGVLMNCKDTLRYH